MVECDFHIDKKVLPNGDITFSTSKSFPNCTVHITINGKPAVPGDIGDYHVIQLGHDSLTVKPLKSDPQGEIAIEVKCPDCGPTTHVHGVPPSSSFSIPKWLAVLIFPVLLLIWIGWMAWEKIQDLWHAIRALF